jgi:hypothetical protein
MNAPVHGDRIGVAAGLSRDQAASAVVLVRGA